MPKARSTSSAQARSTAKVKRATAPAKSSVKTRSTRAKTTTAPKAAPQLTARQRAEKLRGFLGENIRKPKVYVPLIVVILLVLLYFFRSLFVVALVNGQPVSRMAYETQLQAQAGKQVMNSLVTQTLIEQEAARQHITVSQSDLDAQVRTIQNQLATQGQTLDSALAAQGLSKDSFMQQLRLQALVEKMLADKIKVTDAEVNDYISKNQSSLPTGESDAQIKAQVKQQLQQQKLSQQAQALVQQLQAKAHITYFLGI